MLGMNAHAMGIRHDLILGEGNSFMQDVAKGIGDYLAATDDARTVPVVNLQCDVDHPTQSMADLLYLRERFPGGLHGKKITVSWAYSPSYAKPLSVPQALITLLPRFGVNVRLAHPPGYSLLDRCMERAREHSAAAGTRFDVTDDMDAAFAGADIVYPKSWGPYDLMLERIAANRAGDTDAMGRIEDRCLERNRLYSDWICNQRRMALTRDALYMHCLPADIGAEVEAGVLEQYRVPLARQANNKLYVIMAVVAAARRPDVVSALTQRLESADA
jgi:ornithine carbamoyltransferase